MVYCTMRASLFTTKKRSQALTFFCTCVQCMFCVFEKILGNFSNAFHMTEVHFEAYIPTSPPPINHQTRKFLGGGVGWGGEGGRR